MTYFASLQEPWDGSGIQEFDAVIMDVLAAYVDRFSPGTLISVDSPHFMEPAIPHAARVSPSVKNVTIIGS